MLFNQKTLDRIQRGEISVAFRKWKRPTVKTGGTLLTPIGLLNIESVEEIAEADIIPDDARSAGFRTVQDLKELLQLDRPGKLYRIRFTVAGPDPRVELRAESDLSDTAIEELTSQLDRLDSRASQGAWTRQVLQLIAACPEQPAAKLAAHCRFEKEWLKANVRKLKNLGLTESLNPGYRLSARGFALLAALESREDAGVRKT